MQTALVCFGIALYLLAAYGDIRALRIPNLLCAAIAAVGVFRLATAGDLGTVFYTIGAAAALFFVGALLFRHGFVGGGDVKLLTASTLLVGYRDLLPFLFVMSVCGLLVSIAVLTTKRTPLPLYLGPKFAVLAANSRLVVPYGVAIAAAGTLTLLFQSSLVGW